MGKQVTFLDVGYDRVCPDCHARTFSGQNCTSCGKFDDTNQLSRTMSDQDTTTKDLDLLDLKEDTETILDQFSYSESIDPKKINLDQDKSSIELFSFENNPTYSPIMYHIGKSRIDLENDTFHDVHFWIPGQGTSPSSTWISISGKFKIDHEESIIHIEVTGGEYYTKRSNKIQRDKQSYSGQFEEHILRGLNIVISSMAMK